MLDPHLIGVCLFVAVVISVFICWRVLIRWQEQVIRRERGERPVGFQVRPAPKARE